VRIKNDGTPILVVKHHQMTELYVPVVVFGVLLSGNNFDDSQERYIGGRNGLGVKLANVLSKRFEIEVVNAERRLKLTHACGRAWTRGPRTPRSRGWPTPARSAPA
jgi:DNA topoisomerase-2